LSTILYGQNYINYQRGVNKAKLLIVDGNYKSALNLYDELFDNFKNHFHKDLYNACILAIYFKDYNKAKEYLIELILLGYQLKDFNKPIFKSLKNSTYWQQIEQLYPELRYKYLSHLDCYNYRKYKLISKEDQKIAFSGMYGECEHDKSVLEISRLLQLDLEREGVPKFVRYKDPMYTKLFVMFRHYFGTKNNHILNKGYNSSCDLKYLDSMKIEKILREEYLKGNLPNDFLVNAQSYYSNKYGINSGIDIVINFKNETVTFSPANECYCKNMPPYLFVKLSRINDNRKLLGLLPMEEECKLFKATSWYTAYPFGKIKTELRKKVPNSLTDCNKIIKTFESKFKKDYKISLINNFILTTHTGYKRIRYIGLEDYVINN
jgi:hypothetical protein